MMKSNFQGLILKLQVLFILEMHWQKQSSGVVLQNRYSYEFRQILRKTTMPESLY